MSSAAGMYQHDIHAAGLYPSQLYESAGGIMIVCVLLVLGRKKLFTLFTGFLFYLTGLMYAVLRFVVDFSRYYGANERLGGLSHNQIVCIVLFIIFGGLILKGLLFKEDAIPGQAPVTTSGPHKE
jgi:prolipoprotein diacylglyceryltransferase